MSGGLSIGFNDFAAFSFEFDHVRYVSVPSFLVRTYLVVSHILKVIAGLLLRVGSVEAQELRAYPDSTLTLARPIPA